VLVRAGALGRWFRLRFGIALGSRIEHPQRAALAQFIEEVESSAPDAAWVADDLVEALYDFGAGGRTAGDPRPNAPLVLMTAHRAKGLEFDHVLILDNGGWRGGGDDERRLFYVGMTRARKSLTLCERIGSRHPFVRDLEGLSLRSRPLAMPAESGGRHRTWCADPEKIVLSWPGYFPADAPIHRALAALDVGSPLALRPRAGGRGWELVDTAGDVVGRMSSSFQPPPGSLVAVRVAAMLARHAREGERERLRCSSWELVIPEIEYVIAAGEAHPLRSGLGAIPKQTATPGS
jgi:ATP-dependent DNA helicase RecQ